MIHATDGAAARRFTLQSHGRTRIINFVPGYTFTYQRIINGMRLLGALRAASRRTSRGDREGLLISMRQRPDAAEARPPSKPVTPDSVATSACCSTPLQRLRFR